MIALAALADCGGYMASGPYGGGGGVVAGGAAAGRSGAVDTVAVGGTVTWTWTNNQGLSHSVQSQGSTAFASSSIMGGNGQAYSVTFTTPGTYQYDCAVHGTAMTGTIVVR